MIKGKFCGGATPKPVMSSSNTMVVRFKSDQRLTSKGFTAIYTKSSLPPVVVPTTTKPTPTATTRPTTQTAPPPTSPGKPNQFICLIHSLRLGTVWVKSMVFVIIYTLGYSTVVLEIWYYKEIWRRPRKFLRVSPGCVERPTWHQDDDEQVLAGPYGLPKNKLREICSCILITIALLKYQNCCTICDASFFSWLQKYFIRLSCSLLIIKIQCWCAVKYNLLIYVLTLSVVGGCFLAKQCLLIHLR